MSGVRYKAWCESANNVIGQAEKWVKENAKK
jgi:hypothetical protein